MKMKLFLTLCFLVFAALPAQAQGLFPDLGGQRTGISGFQFLKIPVSARSAALAQTGITTIADATSIYSNPALAVDVMRNDVSFSYAAWLVELQHISASAVIRLTPRDAIGIGIMALRSPDMDVTTTTNPFGTGETFSYGDFLGALSYSRRMTEQFSFGVTGKLIRENIGAVSATAFAVDLGVCYKLDLLGIRFAATVENFGGTATPSGSQPLFGLDGSQTAEAFRGIEPPTYFRLGISLDPIKDGDNRLTTLAQLNHPNDNAEQIALGVEYAWRNLLYLRAGYNLGREEQNMPDLGLGLNYKSAFAAVKFDYAFVNFKTLGATHRITVSLGELRF